MKSFNFLNNNTFNWKETAVVLLGANENPTDKSERHILTSRLEEKTMLMPNGVWGTLGWSDGKPLQVEGLLEFSELGNENSNGATLKQVQHVWDINPLIQQHNFRVKECFINFDQVDFKWDEKTLDYENIPELKLTLFLNPNEGAIVYYEHSPKGSLNDGDAIVEYILPEKTDENYSSNRGRLEYNFPVLLKNEMNYNEDTGKLELSENPRATSFIVKVLTYKRNPLTANELFNEAKSCINKKTSEANMMARTSFVSSFSATSLFEGNLWGEAKYALLKFNDTKNGFDSVSENKIDPTKKTLLLIHGTFSCTHGSYGELYGTESFLLRKLYNERGYKQILAFDHPTVSEDVVQNVNVLYKRLGGVRFEQPVSLLGFSRGGLVTKWLACDKKNVFFEVDKIMNFSAANGVGFFSSLKSVSRFLTILQRTLPNLAAKLVVALAQFSADYVLSRPGLDQMTPNQERLTTILDANYLTKNQNCKLQAVAADWNHSLVKPKFKKLKNSVLDAGLKLMLGSRHDWVVGTKEQEIRPANSPHPKNIESMHIMNFDLEYVKVDTHEMIDAFFG